MVGDLSSSTGRCQDAGMTVSADRLLVTVAPTGAETAKEDCPQLPTTPDDIARTALECEAAGAAMIHIHVRDTSSLVVQLSTGGSVHDPLDDRLKVLDAGPDSCSLTLGTTNFGDDVFLNPWTFASELYQMSQKREV